MTATVSRRPRLPGSRLSRRLPGLSPNVQIVALQMPLKDQPARTVALDVLIGTLSDAAVSAIDHIVASSDGATQTDPPRWPKRTPTRIPLFDGRPALAHLPLLGKAATRTASSPNGATRVDLPQWPERATTRIPLFDDRPARCHLPLLGEAAVRSASSPNGATRVDLPQWPERAATRIPLFDNRPAPVHLPLLGEVATHNASPLLLSMPLIELRPDAQLTGAVESVPLLPAPMLAGLSHRLPHPVLVPITRPSPPRVIIDTQGALTPPLVEVEHVTQIQPRVPRIGALEIPQLGEPSVSGTLFVDDRSVTSSEPMSRSQRKGRGRRSSRSERRIQNLLRMMLPILLPPVLASSAGPTFGDIGLLHPLYKYQGDGVAFLCATPVGALLADDMGLGKTIQAIVALRLLFRRGLVRRALVVAPNSVVTSWQRHFHEWAPELLAYRLQGSPDDRRLLWRAYADHQFHVGIIPYRSFTLDARKRLPPDVDVLIADEAQNIKNPGTQQSRSLAKQRAKRRWALTGTPLENSLPEFAALLQFVDRQALPRSWNQRGVQSAAGRLMLRRRKGDVLHDLPDLFTHVEPIELTSKQMRAYDLAERAGVVELHDKPRNITNVLTLITRLKQICNSVGGSSAKLEWLLDYVDEAVAEGDKVLVFSQYLDALDEIESKTKDYQPLKYTGALSTKRRTDLIDAFQNADSTHHVMLLQVRSGGLGVTLTAANRVVHFDSWWNPAVQSQATARAHRIGQTKTVFETTLVSTGTIEERIQLLLESKRDLFKRAVDDLSVAGVGRLLSQDELYSLFDDVGDTA